MPREVKYHDPKNLLIVGLDVDEEGSPLQDERATWEVDEAMVRNILVYGVLQPVSVRLEAGKTYVVDGRQRVKAARAAASRQDEAGEYKTKVPCIEVTGDDSRVVGIMASANEIRRDDEVLVKAAKASRMLGMCGSKEEVALAFGRSTKTVDNWLKLLSADPQVHDAIRDGKISAAVGITLSGKSRQDQILALDQILEGANSPATSNGAGTSPAPSSPSPSSSSSGSDRQHPGIKKGWLRKAVKTTAYENLEPDQQAVFSWFLTGHIGKDHWLDKFTWDADEEMDSHG
jgi:ParB family transcriptional regulator, chromosome partitioning protein